jgi:hypothetical protein
MAATIRPEEVEEIKWSDIPARFSDFGEIYQDESLRQEFIAWLDAEGIFYYARPRESFYLFEARELTAKAGKVRVLMEDLS